MSMVKAWKDEQLAWLARLHEVRVRELDPSAEFEEFPDPAPCQVELLQIFVDALQEETSPPAAAEKIAQWVLTVPDRDRYYDIYSAYSNMMGVIFAGANQLSNARHLEILANLTLQLANQPDAYNDKQKPIESERGLVVVQPGEKIKLPCQTGDFLWSTLPDFAQMVGEALATGPAQFFGATLSSGDQHEMYRQAEERYTNINTYAALIAKQHSPEGSPLRSCLHSSFAVFALIENGPDTPRGKFASLAIRAAATWIILAGEEVIKLGASGTKHDYLCGSIWEAQGGTNRVDAKRLRFWRDRFRDLRKAGGLVSQRAVDAATEAEAKLEKLLDALREA